MTEPNTQFTNSLREHKKSVTAARRVVFEALQAQEPLTMRELVEKCIDNIDRASIYRAIELFEKLGIVQRLQIGWKYKLELSNNFNYHHHHLTCTKCNSIIPLPEDPILENRLEYLATQSNFKTIDHQIEIKGICLNCRLETI
jgi:Fur family ferric uptake transcriptional regulator